MSPGPSTDQDGAVERLVSLFLAGAITPQTYVNGLRALAETPLTPAPISPPRRRRALPTRAPRPRKVSSPAGEGSSQFHPARASYPAGEGFSQFHPAWASSPTGEGLPNLQQLAFRRTRWTIGSFLRSWQMDVPQNHPNGADPRAFLEGVRPQIQAKLEEEIEALNGVKFQLALKVQLRKDNPDGNEEYVSPVMRHKQEAALQNSEIDGALNLAFPAIQETLEKWTQRGSGWVVDQVETLWLDIAKYQPLRGGCFLPLPPALRAKKAVVNVKNKGNHCFRWAIRAATFPAARNPQRPSNYPQQDDLDFTGIDAPTPISQIPRFERQNDMAINVFGWDKGLIVHQISKQPEDIPRINLLLIKRMVNFTTPGSKTSIAYSTTVASTRSASTSVSAAFMATEGKIS